MVCIQKNCNVPTKFQINIFPSSAVVTIPHIEFHDSAACTYRANLQHCDIMTSRVHTLLTQSVGMLGLDN